MVLCTIPQLEGSNIEIYRSVFAPVNSNMYAILAGNKAIIIDPCLCNECVGLLKERSISEVTIFLTHEHYDHTSGVSYFQDIFNAKLICNRTSAQIISIAKNNNPALIALVLAGKDKLDGGDRYKVFKHEFKPYSCIASKEYDDNFETVLGGLHFQFKMTPGHSPGSNCIILEDNIIFTGDTLLKDIPTITRFAESDIDDYNNIALPFIESIKCGSLIMPGHGDPFVYKRRDIDE